MRKRLPWMKVKAKVLALGKPGTIMRFNTNTINGVEYVYQMQIRLDGSKFANPYHPDDVQENTDAVNYVHKR